MTQFFVFWGGVIILVFIFIRRHQISERGMSNGSFLASYKKSFADLFRSHKQNRDVTFETSVEEMIPLAESVDSRNKIKANGAFKKADIYLGSGDFKSAEKFLIQGLSLDPSNEDAYNNLGLIYLRQGQFGKAEMMYRKLLLRATEEASYLSNLALALYQQKNLPEAKMYYQKAVEMDQSRPGRFFSLAQVLFELEEFEAALDHFKKAAEMDPKNLDYLLTLAQFYIDRGFPGEARQILNDILAIHPHNEMALQMLAKLTPA